MTKKALFRIIPDSIVKGDSIGHYVCETIPVHPDALILPDRKKKYISLARVILENNLGYIIDTNKKEIHHKDGNPENNDLSNLELRTKSSHAREHSKTKKFWKKSPRTKPGQHRKVALRIISSFLTDIANLQ